MKIEDILTEEPILLADDPAPMIQRLTLNRPAKRRAGADLHALGWRTPASRGYMAQMRQGVKATLSARDSAFGDYRTKEN